MDIPVNMPDDPFATLGLHREASLEEVRRAYRRLAMRWHPDRNPSLAAENEFKRIKNAYELILDPERFALWQQAQATRATGAGAEPPRSDGEDVTQALILSLEEAARGCMKSIDLGRSNRCTGCHGSGKKQLKHSLPCALCNGCGRVRGDRRGTHLCEGCGGRGYLREAACEECAGSGWQKKSRTLSVKVPPGILAGERLRLARQARHGAAGESAGAGDLYLEIALAPHPLFELQQRDLHCAVPVSIFRLLCGGRIEVPTLTGNVALDLASYPAHGLEYRLPGHGFPKKHGRGAGDLVLRLLPVYPGHPGARDRALLERLEAQLTADLAERAPALAAWAAHLRERRAPA